MSNDDTSTTESTEQQAEAQDAPRVYDEAYVANLRAEAAKYRTKARDNATAAEELSQLREAQMSETDKANARAQAAETRAAEAEARAVRADIAREHKLDAEDAALLDGMTDEGAMRALAARLARAADVPPPATGFVVDSSGRQSGASNNTNEDAGRMIFGF